jgi:DNA adenine methylase
MKIPHPIPYQGSKRIIAKFVLPLFPRGARKLIEPFAGSAAISIAAACHGKASYFHLNDINQPLIVLWESIINKPENLALDYHRLWQEQQGNERAFYDKVRDEFNRTQQPHDLLYLLARCVKASIRYNAKGEFNQSPDNRRLGRNPEQMAADIRLVSKLFRNRTLTTSQDYKAVLELATSEDLVYLDPPYQGVCNSGDPRYYTGIHSGDFIQSLDYLNRRMVPFILSYDGRTGNKSFGNPLPAELNLLRLEIEAGRSSQSTLLGRSDITYESVYLSEALVERLNVHPARLLSQHTGYKARQLEFSIQSG